MMDNIVNGVIFVILCLFFLLSFSLAVIFMVVGGINRRCFNKIFREYPDSDCGQSQARIQARILGLRGNYRRCLANYESDLKNNNAMLIRSKKAYEEAVDLIVRAEKYAKRYGYSLPVE